MSTSVDLGKMKKLLSFDVPQVSVAAALGVSEGLVSQYMSDPQFSSEVASMKLARLEGLNSRDDLLDKIEDKVLNKLEKAVDYMMRPGELLAALKVVNGAQRRGSSINGVATQQLAQTVNILIPQAIAVTYIQNANSEIIEAGGRSLTTLPSNILKKMAGASNNPKPQSPVSQLGVPANVQRNQERVPLETGGTQEFQTYEAAAA